MTVVVGDLHPLVDRLRVVMVTGPSHAFGSWAPLLALDDEILGWIHRLASLRL